MPRKQPQNPSDLNAAFQWEYLTVIAQIAFDRAKWVADHIDALDSGVCIGLRRWTHIKRAITNALHEYGALWLGVPDPGPRFVGSIKGVPFRFYRGDAEEPVPAKYAQATLFEDVFADSVRDESAIVYRFIVEVDGLQQPTGVFFAGLKAEENADVDGEIIYNWSIPIDTEREQRGDDDMPIAPIAKPKAPVPLAPIEVKTRAEEDAEKRADADRLEKEAREHQERERAKRERNNRDTKGA
jgi:hypothetical protein